MFHTIVVPVVLFVAGGTNASNDEHRIQVASTKDGWTIQKNGAPYEVLGVGGGEDDLARLAVSGVTTIRTWGINDSTANLLDAAHEHGLMVLVGLWMGHVGDGFDYEDTQAVENQQAALVALAEPLKDHPALFGWGIGNEVEFENDVPEVWSAIGSLASAIKTMDPDHPTVAVTAELGSANEQRLEMYGADIDIWGINTYGGLSTLPDRLASRGWSGPYLVTEYAHEGDWEIQRTSWGSPLEPSSRAKALAYQEGWETVIATDPRCVGGFAFVWRGGRSPSDTWFPMLSWDGRGTEATDRIRTLFTGSLPADRAPSVGGIIGNVAGEVFAPGQSISTGISAVDPEGEPLSVEWFVAREVLDPDGRWVRTSSNSVCIDEDEMTLEMVSPSTPGAYRLIAFVSDGGPSVGTASAPFLVESITAGYQAVPTFAIADHFHPTGWMGDTVGLRLDACFGPAETCGGICTRLDWSPSSSNWFGLLWQYPPHNWGDEPGLTVAPGADRVGFYAWSDPASTATFRVGGGNDGFLKERTVDLDTSPRWIEMKLDPDEYSNVATGFGVLASGPTARTIWISEATWIADVPPECKGDINNDGFIGSSDLGLLLGAWGGSADTLPMADLDDDGMVSASDLGLLTANWGPCPS